jgi:phosphoenolpyruvate carboxylase
MGITKQQDMNYNPASDKELRSRVRLFGDLLGEVLREQAGESILFAVETLRRGYIRLRKQENPALRKRLSRVIENLEPDDLTDVIRAFNLYFSLVNIAEESVQHRQRRQQTRRHGPLWYGSFTQTLQEFRDQDIDAGQLQLLLNQTLYLPVFTAHPTEAIRRTVMFALRRIFVTSDRLHDHRLGRDERKDIRDAVKREIQVLWKTDEVRIRKPSVEDEIRNGLYFFRESLFEAVPQTYRYLEKAMRRVYGDNDGTTAISAPGGMIQFGSWIGGDRDGNPFVKPQTTAMALRLHMREILILYLRCVEELGYRLTHSLRLCAFSPALLESIEADARTFSSALPTFRHQYKDEPYRRKLRIMRHRIRLNLAAVSERLAGPDGDHASQETGYATEQDFLKDLLLIRESLCAHGDANLAQEHLQDLIRLV